MTGEPTTSQVTETLVLYKHPQLYNGSRYKFYHNTRNYDNWLNSTSSGRLSLEINYQSISEPIRITYSLPVMDEYTYGSLTNNGKKYYIFIDTIETDQYGVSVFNFTVDWWATEWADLSCTIAHVSRKSSKPGYMEQPFTPLKTTYSYQRFGEENTFNFTIMFTYIPSGDTEYSYIGLGMLDANERNISLVENGYWYQSIDLPGSDIKDCFIVPLIRASEILQASTCYEELMYLDSSESTSSSLEQQLQDSYNKRFYNNGYPSPWYIAMSNTTVYDKHTKKFYNVSYTLSPLEVTITEIEDPTINYRFLKITPKAERTQVLGEKKYYYLSNLSYYKERLSATQFSFSKTYSGLNIYSDERIRMGIQDWNSDIIWECPYGQTITSFDVRLNIGISHVILDFIPNSSGTNSSKINGLGFSYDCRHPGLFIDSYKDYVLKNRDYDIAMRQIQSDKQLWSAVTSMAENVGFGIAFGQGTGGVAAGLGGLIETIGTYAINSTFDPKIQEQYDEKYRRVTDQISLVGDSISALKYERVNGIMKIYTLTMDTATYNRMNTDINTNGYYCDETTSTLQSSYFGINNKVQADNTVVEGAVPLACKQQIVRRLQNGVEFI